jgi:hypothetical protein
VKYDNDASAVVLETKMDNKLVQRYWIDPSRGYVCPLIQVYDTKTSHLKEEYKSENYFIHEETGLWFPKKHEEFEYETSGQLKISREYEIDAATFKVNQTVSDKEFAVDVAEGYNVTDNRDKKNDEYVAVEKGTLTLGELNLDKTSWLAKKNTDSQLPIRDQNPLNQTVCLILAIGGIVLILLALLRMFRKKK